MNDVDERLLMMPVWVFLASLHSLRSYNLCITDYFSAIKQKPLSTTIPAGYESNMETVCGGSHFCLAKYKPYWFETSYVKIKFYR